MFTSNDGLPWDAVVNNNPFILLFSSSVSLVMMYMLSLYSMKLSNFVEHNHVFSYYY